MRDQGNDNTQQHVQMLVTFVKAPSSSPQTEYQTLSSRLALVRSSSHQAGSIATPFQQKYL